MIENVLAQRYAKALAGIAEDRGIIDRISSEMLLLADIFSSGSGAISIPELTNVLGMPRISLEKKIHITDIMLEKLDFSEEVGNLLNVLITKNRVGLISKITEFYCRRTAALKGVASVNIETAQKLDENERKGIKAALENSLGRAVELNTDINEELIGGVRIRINDTMIDKSIDGALNRLQDILR